jgi:hypothetical protein
MLHTTAILAPAPDSDACGAVQRGAPLRALSPSPPSMTGGAWLEQPALAAGPGQTTARPEPASLVKPLPAAPYCARRGTCQAGGWKGG